MMAAKDFKLPDLGEGLTESELVSWRVNVGDTIEMNQIIAEVETAKALVELPSPYAGVISSLYVDPGTTVQVGAPIMAVKVDDGSDVPGDGSGETMDAGAPAPQERNPVLVGYGPPVDGTAAPRRRRRAVSAPDVSASSDESVEHAETPTTSTVTPDRPRSTPPVRKLARDLSVDLTEVTGTGPSGLITRDDVNKHAAQRAQEPEAAAASAGRITMGTGEREVRTPIKGVRKHTAAAMVASAFTAPHVTEFLTLDVTPTMELLSRLKANRAYAGYRINVLTVVAKAMCIAAARTPSVNSRWDGGTDEIVQLNYVNLGIAVATPRGLMVPNIADADRLTLPELAAALAELTETARSGKTRPAQLSGGTMSITNVGVFGVDAGTPILNPGEAVILAMGAVRTTPWEYHDEVALRQVMTLSLSFDHRLVDGEQGSRFLTDVGAILADPGMILTMV